MNPSDIKKVEHDRIEISWYNIHKYTRRNQDVTYYNIEISQGREGAGLEGGGCSHDYKVVDYVPAGIESNFNSQIQQLSPNTAYCIRVIAIGDRGASKKTLPIIVTTLQSPQNRWWPHHPRDNYDLLKMVIQDETPSCTIPDYPTPRRGHSMSFVNDKVYLFGGLTNKCICDGEGATRDCQMQTVYTNEVWVLNTYTNIWKLLKEHSRYSTKVPRGREQHSATVLPNGKVLIIGGRSDLSSAFKSMEKPSILGDVWEMDPGQIKNYKFRGSEGENDEDLPVEIGDGQAVYLSQQVTLFTDNAKSFEGDKQCLVDLSIEVSLYHPCVEALGFIALYGPGSTPSSNRPSRFTGDDLKVRI